MRCREHGIGGAQRTGRVTALDALRGITIISMACFHAVYDLAYLFMLPLPWFTEGPFQDIWRDSISWTFLFLAGWMCAHSRDNLKRAVRYGLVALAVFIATSLTRVDTPISFGIIYCMAASTLVATLTLKATKRLPSLALAAAALLAFLLALGVPKAVYSIGGLAWLGFPSPTFVSGDYYPVIPFSLLFLSGAFASRRFVETGRVYPTWMYGRAFGPLAAIGRHSLLVYVVHQPIILLVLELLL